MVLIFSSCSPQISGKGEPPMVNGGDDGIPAASLNPYVQSFKDRYGISVGYPIEWDNSNETGGSGQAGTTVGVCRVWTSGYREILINKNWWIDQQKVEKSCTAAGTQNNQNTGTCSFGSLERRKNAKMNVTFKNSGSDIIDVNSITSSNSKFFIKSKTCSGSPTQTCVVDVRFNLEENESVGNYSTFVSNGTRGFNLTVSVVASAQETDLGEYNRQILIWHEMGHCSFGRDHDCQTDTQSGSNVRCPGTNSSSDAGNYTAASTSNAPVSMMYPTINPIVHWYMSGDGTYNKSTYDNELEDNKVGNYGGGNLSMAAGVTDYEPEQNHSEVEHIEKGSIHANCVKFMD